jgi:hypothetical protein
MRIPPPVLAGLYVVAYANADHDVVFEQRQTLNVDGQWLGRMPSLAICQDFNSGEYSIQHCTEDWELTGVAGGYGSMEEAKVRIERSYHGISNKLMLANTSIKEARAIYEAELLARACSFCGRTPLQYTTVIGDSVRICGQCVDEFYAAIHDDESSS